MAGLSANRPAAIPGSRKPASARSAPSQVRRSDTEIEKDIRARLARSKISADAFQVHVQGGIATLEGKTDIVQHKGVATRLARSGGAIQVVNRIQVSQAARDRAARNLATGRRRAQIKRGETRDGRTQAARQRGAN